MYNYWLYQFVAWGATDGASAIFFRWKTEPAKFLLARMARAASRQLDAFLSGLVLPRSGRSRHAPWFAPLLLAFGLCGCSGSRIIDFYAADYRETVATAGDSQLLLNILRAKDNLPMHFYDLSNIHGSIQLTAGATATLPFANFAGSATPSSASPSLAAQSSPTFDLGTTDTQEFTRGLLSQLDPRVVKTLFDQGVDPRIMLLLFFSRYTDRNHQVFLNTMACDPTKPGHHPEFGCFNQVYDYLGQIDRLLGSADVEAGVGPHFRAKLQANTYTALRPVGGSLAGAWTLDNLEQLRQLDATSYKLIGKQLYTISGLRLAICYEGVEKKLHSLVPWQYPDAACTQHEIIDHRPETVENIGLQLRSTYDIIQFLGQVLRFQQEQGENRCLTLGSKKDQRTCDTGEVLFQVNAPVGTPLIATRYGDATYALFDRGCNRNFQQPCDYSIQVLAILELLINENKAAKDIIATPRVHFVP
jgi:hypothetical protein